MSKTIPVQTQPTDPRTVPVLILDLGTVVYHKSFGMGRIRERRNVGRGYEYWVTFDGSDAAICAPGITFAQRPDGRLDAYAPNSGDLIATGLSPRAVIERCK